MRRGGEADFSPARSPLLRGIDHSLEVDMRPNPFLSTRSLCGECEEDHLTEFWAAALDSCPAFREAYCRFLLAGHADRRGWGELRIASVATQVNFGGNVPDLVLGLVGTGGLEIRVAVEHKIFARESRSGRSQENDEEKVLGQLSRYLSVPEIDGVAFVRLWPQALDPRVLHHEKYIRPGAGMHFLWWHFYPLLEACADECPAVRWLKEGFEQDGLTPPLERVPLLRVPGDDERERANRGEFAKLMELAAVRAAEAGWRPNFDQHGAELYLRRHPSSWAQRVLFSGIGQPQGRARRQPGLRVWVTPRQGEEQGAIERLRPAVASGLFPRPPEIHRLPKGTVEFYVAFSELLAGAEDAETIRARFSSLAEGVLLCL